jgi:hypothetical protein
MTLFYMHIHTYTLHTFDLSQVAGGVDHDIIFCGCSVWGLWVSLCTCIHTCVCVYVYMYTCMYVFIHTHTNNYMYRHACIYVYIYIYIYAYIHIIYFRECSV